MPRPALAVGRHGDIGYRQSWPGRWTAETYIRDQDGTRRRVRATGDSKTAAKMALEDKLETRQSFLASGITPDMTVAELVAYWLADHGQRITPQTKDKYQRLLDKHIRPRIGNLRITEATTGRIDAFLKAVSIDTPTLARHCRTVLSNALGLAVRHDALSANPVRETATVIKKKPEIRVLSVEELNELRAMVDRWQQGLNKLTGEPQRITRPRADDLLDVTDMLAATGARIGELFALRWVDVVFGDKTGGKTTVTISGTLTMIKGQGLVRQDHPKTASGWRTITLPDFAADLLRSYWVERQPEPGDPVFPSHTGTFRSPNNFRRQWRDAIQGTGYEWVTPHSFRRTVATLVDRELSTEDAAAQLGHSGTNVTRQHYIAKAHQAPDLSEVLQQLKREVRDAPSIGL